MRREETRTGQEKIEGEEKRREQTRRGVKKRKQGEERK